MTCHKFPQARLTHTIYKPTLSICRALLLAAISFMLKGVEVSIVWRPEAQRGRAVSQWKQCQGQKSYLLAFWLELFFFTSLQTICAPSRIGFSEPKGKSEKDCLLVGSLLNSTVELNYGENYCLRIPRSNIERGTRTHPSIYIYISKSARVALAASEIKVEVGGGAWCGKRDAKMEWITVFINYHMYQRESLVYRADYICC